MTAPDQVVGLLLCPNSGCIINHEVGVPTRILVASAHPLVLDVTGPTVLQIFTRLDFDATMNGTQLAEKLEKFPVILVSGREDAINAGKNHPNIIRILIKPYDRHDLKKALSAMHDKE